MNFIKKLILMAIKSKNSDSSKKCFITGSSEIYGYPGSNSEKAIPLCKEAYDELVNAYCYERTTPGFGNTIIGDTDIKNGIIKSNRTFGAELECFTTVQLNLLALRKLANSYNNVGEDGSINGGYSAEIRVCPMRKIGGEKHLKETCDLLKSLNFETNTSCGTHVHIGIPEAMSTDAVVKKGVEEKLKNLFTFYLIFEPAIRILLPKNRAQNSNYCLPMSRGIRSDYVQFENDTKKPSGIFAEKEFSKFRSSVGGFTRYLGINFNSLYEHKTLEIRYHEGTIDAEEILHWIAFHSAIVDLIMDGTLTEDQITSYIDISTDKELLDTLMELLGDRVRGSTIEYLYKRFEKFKDTHPLEGYRVKNPLSIIKQKEGMNQNNSPVLIETTDDEYGDDDDDDY